MVGYKRQLNMDDIPQLIEQDTTAASMAAAANGGRGFGTWLTGGGADDGSAGGSGGGSGGADDGSDLDGSSQFEKAVHEFKRHNHLYMLAAHIAPWEFYTGGLFTVLGALSSFAPALAINIILGCLDESNGDDDKDGGGDDDGGSGKDIGLEALIGLTILFVAPLLQGICDTQRMTRGKRVGVRLQSTAVSLVYQHALRTDTVASSFSVGEAVNLMATDGE